MRCARSILSSNRSLTRISLKLAGALECEKTRRGKTVWVTNKEGRVAMRTTDIKYVEVVQHMLIWHTTRGDVRASGQLSDAESLLSGEPFAYCNRCYYVNLRFVTALRGHEVYLGDECLVVSRMKRAAFADALSAFLAGGG